MSEPKLISPLLDNFMMGDPISEHRGVRCCPAIQKDTDNKYIVKIISVPSSQTQLDALLLSGAYDSREAAVEYFKTVSEDIIREAEILKKLEQLEGFLSFESWQIHPMEGDEAGFDVYLLGTYKRTLGRYLRKRSMTHLAALNLALDICSSLSVCRRAGYLYVDLKPENIYILNDQEFRIGDIGFLRLDSLKYASLPDRYRSNYTAPEIADAFSQMNTTVDTYALGLILYQVFNDGILPVIEDPENPQPFAPPAYADYEMAEIILKACSPDPAQRWQDPAEMGTALVSYMQRNGAHDVPIVPVISAPEEVAEEAPVEAEAPEEAPAEEVQEAEASAEIQEEEPSAEVLEDVQQLTVEDILSEYQEQEDTDDSMIPEAPAQEPEETPEEAEPEAPVSEEAEADTEDAPQDLEAPEAEEDAPPSDPQESVEDTASEDEIPTEISIEEIFTEDNEGNLTMIDVPSEDETAPDNTDEEISYTEVSDEVSDILEQADELIAHKAPDPVVAPEPIEIPIPDPIVIPEEEAQEEAQDETNEDASQDAQEEMQQEEPEATAEESEAPEEEQKPKKRKGRWLVHVLLVLILAGLIVGGFFFYKHYYLQPIESMVLEETDSGVLTVYVTSQVPEDKLTVLCADTYGNQLTSPVQDGKAVFTDLSPSSAYNVSVVINGFHKLTGDTSASYTTPDLTNILHLRAVTGSEDGSVIIGFTIDGPDAEQWKVTYQADTGEAKEVAFSGHNVTINGLTVGHTYEFTLLPVDNIHTTGQNRVEHTASTIVKASSVRVTSCLDETLVAQWSVAEGIAVSSWTVRCYNDSGYDQTMQVSESTAQFQIPDAESSYTVEVTAEGMSVSERTFVPENSVTVENFSVSAANANRLNVSWNPSGTAGSGWKVLYSINGSPAHEISDISGNSAHIEPIIPGCKYEVTLQTADGVDALSGYAVYQAPAAEKFVGYGVSSEYMSFSMCKTPSYSYWDHSDLRDSDYTTTFKPGQKASYVARMRSEYSTSEDTIVSLFVVKNASGEIVHTCSSSRRWIDMWYKNYCELDIPSLPNTPGEYTISVYFNGALAHQNNFTISE